MIFTYRSKYTGKEIDDTLSKAFTETATAQNLGGIKANPTTTEDTQEVHVNKDGFLLTKSGSTLVLPAYLREGTIPSEYQSVPGLQAIAFDLILDEEKWQQLQSMKSGEVAYVYYTDNDGFDGWWVAISWYNYTSHHMEDDTVVEVEKRELRPLSCTSARLGNVPFISILSTVDLDQGIINLVSLVSLWDSNYSFKVIEGLQNLSYPFLINWNSSETEGVSFSPSLPPVDNLNNNGHYTLDCNIQDAEPRFSWTASLTETKVQKMIDASIGHALTKEY